MFRRLSNSAIASCLLAMLPAHLAAPVRGETPIQVGSTAANAPVDLALPVEAYSAEPDDGFVRRAARVQPSTADADGAAGVVSRGGSPAADMPAIWWPLAAVLAVLACCAFAARRWLMPARPAAGGSAIRVLSRQYLSNRQSLCLARFGRRVVLLGVTPDRICTLSELTDADEVSEILMATERGRAGSFSTMFDRFLEREATTESADEPAGGGYAASVRPTERQVADARQRVAELVDRVRSLSSDVRVAAEPPRSVRRA